MNNYSGFAHYYDKYASEFDYDEWLQYLITLSGVKDFRGKQVLDLGCGSGILLSEFAELGAKAIGVDRSSDMLAEADQKLFLMHKKAELILADISEFSSDQTFDFIYSTCDAVNYLTVVQLESFIRNATLMLKPGARLTFDMLNRENFTKREETDEFQIDGVTFLFRRSLGRKTLRTKLRITDGAYLIKEDHTQYFHSVQTVREIAEQCGLTLLGVYRIYGFDAPDSDAEKIQIVLEKAEININ